MWKKSYVIMLLLMLLFGEGLTGEGGTIFWPVPSFNCLLEDKIFYLVVMKFITVVILIIEQPRIIDGIIRRYIAMVKCTKQKCLMVF